MRRTLFPFAGLTRELLHRGGAAMQRGEVDVPTGSGSAVLYFSFDSVDQPGLVAWSRFREQVLAALEGPAIPADLPQAGRVGVWRLLASNNREVARSAGVFDSFDSAKRAVALLQERWEELEVETFHGPVSATHGWAATLGGIPVVTCSRWYETGPISLDVSAASIESLRCARIAEAPMHLSGSARLSPRPVMSRLP